MHADNPDHGSRLTDHALPITAHGSRCQHLRPSAAQRTLNWNPDFLSTSPLFEPLRAHAPAFGADWPDRAALQRLLGAGEPVRTAAGKPVRLVPPARGPAEPEDRYESRLYRLGELEVRERSWHDLFNVLVWRAFPLAKAALNARHHAEMRAGTAAAGGGGNRGPAQEIGRAHV